MKPEESLDIIANMMSQTRRNVLRHSYFPFLAMGWTTIFVGLAVYASLIMTADARCYYIWFALPVIGGMILLSKNNKNENFPKTTLTTPLRSIWIMLAVLLVSFSIYSFLAPFNILFFEMLLLAIGCFITGALIRYPLLQYSSIIGFIITGLLWFIGGSQEILFFVIGIFAMMILPAYKMKNDLKHEELNIIQKK